MLEHITDLTAFLSPANRVTSEGHSLCQVIDCYPGNKQAAAWLSLLMDLLISWLLVSVRLCPS